MNAERSYRCLGCQAVVSIPKGRRNLTLEQVKRTHDETCPTRRAKQ